MIELKIAKSVPKNHSKIYLIDSVDEIDSDEFSSAELKYIQKQIENKKKEIFINNYERIICILIPDTEKEFYKITEDIRRAGEKICKYLNSEEIKEISLITDNNKTNYISDLLLGIFLTNYQFLDLFTKEDKLKLNSLQKIKIKAPNIEQNILDNIITLSEAIYKTRDLINQPLSHLGVKEFVNEAKEFLSNSGCTIEVLNKKQIESLKMGGLLAVNKGSENPPAFLIIEWKPEKAKNDKPIVFVGKGILYDSGGYSLKPTPKSMDYMKSDMGGAATVLGAISAIAKNKLPIHTISLIPLTDNLINSKAYVPGDVIKMHNKLTVEVLNTDAEGRLILADALSYASKYNPELVCDFATLTGHAVVALGAYGTLVMGTAEKSDFELLEQTGYETYERVVRFPNWDEYGKELESKIADLKNVGERDGGAITAGKFLENFTNYPWIHFDIASNSYIHKPMNYHGSGGTGIGLRLIYQFLINKYLDK